MIYYSLSALINFLTSFVLGSLVISRNYKSPLNRAFGLFALSVGSWSFCYFLWQISSTAEEAFFWCQSLMIGAVFIPSTFFHFSVTLIGKSKFYINKIRIFYGLSIVFFLLNFTPLLVKDVSSKLCFNFWPNAGSAYLPFLIMFVGIVIYAHFLLFRQLKDLQGIARNQIKYVSLGTLIGFIGGATNYPLWYGIPILPVGNVFVSVYIILVAFAIIKYRLLDIEIVLTRATIFVFVYTLVLGIPVWVGTKMYGFGFWLIPVGLMGVFATAGPFIYLFIQKRAEDKIFEEQRRYQKTLRQVSAGMGQIKDLNKLLNLIVDSITGAVGLEHAHIYVRDADSNQFVLGASKQHRGAHKLPQTITADIPLIKYLLTTGVPVIYEEVKQKAKEHNESFIIEIEKTVANLDGALVFPLLGNDQLQALIVLGRKESGKLYTEDDLTVLTILANNASLAMENCLFLQTEKERLIKEGAQARRESMDMLVSTMAHEIDNPIAVVIGQSEVLEMILEPYHHLLPPKTLELIKSSSEQIRKDAMRVSKIIKAVEDYSKAESGQYRAVNIHDVIIPYHSLVTLLRKKYQNVQFTEDIASNLSPVWAEEITIEEILINLTENAFHASTRYRPAEAKVNLRIFEKDNVIVIEMKDNGYGIELKILKQLFQVPTTTKGSMEGTGLGLYRIRQIVDRLKGKARAESEGKGHGATFTIELPVHKGDDSAQSHSQKIF